VRRGCCFSETGRTPVVHVIVIAAVSWIDVCREGATRSIKMLPRRKADDVSSPWKFVQISRATKGAVSHMHVGTLPPPRGSMH